MRLETSEMTRMVFVYAIEEKIIVGTQRRDAKGGREEAMPEGRVEVAIRAKKIGSCRTDDRRSPFYFFFTLASRSLEWVSCSEQLE